jgi:hypothetical protein
MSARRDRVVSDQRGASDVGDVETVIEPKTRRVGQTRIDAITPDYLQGPAGGGGDPAVGEAALACPRRVGSAAPRLIVAETQSGNGDRMRYPGTLLSCATALVLLGGGACKDAGQASNRSNQQSASASDQVKTEQQKAEQGLKRAEDAQKKAADEQSQATRAQQDVQDAQRKLTEAQQKEQKERSEAQQAQSSAQQQGQAAQQEVTQAQQRAAQAQQTEQAQQQTAQAQQAQQAQQQQSSATQSAQGEQTVTGRVSKVNGTELALEAANPSRLKLSDSTQILVDGQTGSASQIAEGSNVRAAYRMDGSDAIATRIEVKSK